MSAGPAAPAIRAERHVAFRAGQRAILQSLPGTAAWALICGVALVKGGLPIGWALAMSVSVYAASAQLATLPMVVAGAPLWVIVATGFITNLRFVIYSAALRPYFAMLPLRVPWTVIVRVPVTTLTSKPMRSPCASMVCEISASVSLVDTEPGVSRWP